MEMYRVVKNYEKTLIPTTDEEEKSSFRRSLINTIVLLFYETTMTMR